MTESSPSPDSVPPKSKVHADIKEMENYAASDSSRSDQENLCLQGHGESLRSRKNSRRFLLTASAGVLDAKTPVSPRTSPLDAAAAVSWYSSSKDDLIPIQ